MSGNEESAAQEQPTRCWLVSWSTLAGASYSEVMAGNFDPSLGTEVGKDAIRVIDMNTKALVASAPLAQVTATPAKHEEKYRRRRGALPILVVCIPGAQRLTIGCIEPAQGFGQRLESIYRFWWQDPVPQEKAPAYFGSSADWLTLVEKFGRATQLEDSQPLESPAPPAPSPEASPLY